MLDYNILMLVHPSSGDNMFYKVKDANFIILTDSVGNEPEGETAKFYVLKKKYNRICGLQEIIHRFYIKFNATLGIASFLLILKFSSCYYMILPSQLVT